MTYMNNQDNSKPLSTKFIILVVVVIILAFLEVLAFGLYWYFKYSDSDNTKEANEQPVIVYNYEKPSDVTPMSQPIPETKTEVVVVTAPPAPTPAPIPTPNPTPVPTPEPVRFKVSDAEQLVRNSVYDFASSFPSKDSSYVYKYFSSGLAEKEANTFRALTKSIDSENVIYISCSGTQISANKFSVTRNSTIRVYRTNGEVKDATETYKYIVEAINNRLYITSCYEA